MCESTSFNLRTFAKHNKSPLQAQRDTLMLDLSFCRYIGTISEKNKYFFFV